MSESLLAEILGSRLAAMFSANEPREFDHGNGAEKGFSPDLLPRYEEVVERNGALAAALGACECWGERVECLVCYGTGRPGWIPPDPLLFSRFVRPAVKMVSRLRSAQNDGTKQVRKPMNGV